MSQRSQPTIAFADETTPTRTRKPAGVSAAGLFRAAPARKRVLRNGPPPTDATQMTFLATDTRTPYLATFDGADGGKPAHTMLRWINTKGQPGPWSETATATVGAQVHDVGCRMAEVGCRTQGRGVVAFTSDIRHRTPTGRDRPMRADGGIVAPHVRIEEQKALLQGGKSMSTTMPAVSLENPSCNSRSPGARHRRLSHYVRVSIDAILLGISLVVLGGPEDASAQEPIWVQSHPVLSPSPRRGHAMAYDSRRGVTVLFGGYDVDRRDGETWEWDGATWTLRAVTGPSARYEHALAYDSARDVIVLFGGAGARGLDSETWEWNGATWTLRAVTGPSARYEHALAYDNARRVTVMFGGFDVARNGETWEWDGVTWALRAATGPAPRVGHAMAYDSRCGVTILSGGHDDDVHGWEETWAWDGEAWSLRASTDDPVRTYHAIAADSIRGVTVLFGGYDGLFDDETWEWDGAAWRLRAAAGPSGRSGHAMAYDSARGVVVLFGGYDDSLDGETWEYAPDCNGNGVPDGEDIRNETSTDQDSNGIPDECEPCEFVSRFKAKNKDDRGRCRIRASVLTTLAEGTELTVCFKGDEDCGCVTATVNDRGRAKAGCITLNKGDHRVCIQECPDLCRTVTCQP